MYISLLSQLGSIGLALGVGLLLYVSVSTLRAFANTDGQIRNVALSILAVQVAVLINGIGVDMMRWEHTWYFLSFGLVVYSDIVFQSRQ
jgi:hypothetical protein